MSSTHITARELFDNIAEVACLVAAGQTHVNRQLHQVLLLACQGALANQSHSFGNLFSQVTHLCKQFNISPSDSADIQQMRRHGNSSEEFDAQTLAYDCRALAVFVQAVYQTAVPHTLVGLIPHTTRPAERVLRRNYPYLRCMVDEVHAHHFFAHTEEQLPAQRIRVELQQPHHHYLSGLLKSGMQLNLLDFHAEEAGADVRRFTDTPTAIVVVEPDFLMDISAIARCFTTYGHHPLAYTVNRLSPQVNTRAILLGNFAGCALDDVVNRPNNHGWKNSLKTSFAKRPIDYITCADLQVENAFKPEAIRQTENIAEIVEALFDTPGTPFVRENAVLEPSFVCEQLGIKGRVDLMTTDMKLLVEQKSGKNFNIEQNRPNAHGSFQKEEHYVQLLLYYGVLQRNFGLLAKQTAMHLLYSKYALPGGLVEVNFYRSLFQQAIALRNQIVHTEFDMAQRGFEHYIDQLTPQTLNQTGTTSTFFTRYIEPQLQAVMGPLHHLSDVERAYVCRMATFVLQEQIAGKTRTEAAGGSTEADLWNMPLHEKQETGNIFAHLRLVNKAETTPGAGFNLLTFAVEEVDKDFLPNFRRGDMVLVYAVPRNAVPDARKALLYKGVLANLSTHTLEVQLNDGQQNPNIFNVDANENYVVEHAASDMQATMALKSLQTFAAALPQRRSLLLGTRRPETRTRVEPIENYHPDYNEVVQKAKQANDFFLLVGPPGTGKTSMALRFLVNELVFNAAPNAPHDPPPAALLMAYTNRAVDEICDMLLQANYPFVRLGSEHSCHERFKPHLVSTLVAQTPKLNALKQQLSSVPIVVATTSAVAASTALFGLRSFAWAMIDEAGQILEPNLLGILSAQTPHGTSAIERFILIGDYKQLPAVVRQPAHVSAVNHPQLNAVGLYNCNTSLFERLMRLEQKAGRTANTAVLRKQGRMHPQVACFANTHFYAAERIEPVPLPHQQTTHMGYTQAPADALDRHLLAHRMAFFPSKNCHKPTLSHKVNTHEATIVAQLLVHIERLWGPTFDVRKTVGVIVPYRNQIAMIRRELDNSGHGSLAQVSIDTVERYQGSQRDIIIYAFTIQHRYQLDFLTANVIEENGTLIDRKLNVALTRARQQMLVVGNPETLQHNRIFAQLMSHIAQQNGVFQCV